MSYRAREARGPTDHGELQRLWVENLPVRGDPEAKRRWYYQEGPAGPGGAFVLEHAAPEGAQVVGCAGIGVRRFLCGGRPARAALMADFAIDAPHRTVRPALLLQRTVRQHLRGGYDFSYGFPNAAALGVFRRIGYHSLGAIGRYVRPLRHAPYLRQRLPVGAGVTGLALDGAEQAWQAAVQGRPGAPLRLVWLADVDERFDRLWQAEHGIYPVIAERGAAFLRWRFLRQPGEQHRMAGLVRADTDELRAYAVVQVDGARAHLADFFGAPEAVGALLFRLGLALRRQGMDSMSLRFLGAPVMEGLLRRCGFRLRAAERTIVIDPGLMTLPALHDPQSYYLTDADEDA